MDLYYCRRFTCCNRNCNHGIFSSKHEKRRQEVSEVHTSLKVGSKILFAGGLYGRITKINNDETIDVEISKGVIVKASRYSIQNIEKK